MKRYSDKRQERNDEAQPVRDALVAAADGCEWCGRRLPVKAHEISQGVDREASLDEPACILLLCAACHRLLHRMPEQRAVGLAILRASKRGDFNLRRFYEITDREFPQLSDVLLWGARMNIDRKPIWEF